MCLSGIMVRTPVRKSGDLRFKFRFRHKFFINSNITRACGFTEKITNDEVVSLGKNTSSCYICCDYIVKKHKLIDRLLLGLSNEIQMDVNTYKL